MAQPKPAPADGRTLSRAGLLRTSEKHDQKKKWNLSPNRKKNIFESLEVFTAGERQHREGWRAALASRFQPKQEHGRIAKQTGRKR